MKPETLECLRIPDFKTSRNVNSCRCFLRRRGLGGRSASRTRLWPGNTTVSYASSDSARVPCWTQRSRPGGRAQECRPQCEGGGRGADVWGGGLGQSSVVFVLFFFGWQVLGKKQPFQKNCILSSSLPSLILPHCAKRSPTQKNILPVHY